MSEEIRDLSAVRPRIATLHIVEPKTFEKLEKPEGFKVGDPLVKGSSITVSDEDFTSTLGLEFALKSSLDFLNTRLFDDAKKSKPDKDSKSVCPESSTLTPSFDEEEEFDISRLVAAYAKISRSTELSGVQYYLKLRLEEFVKNSRNSRIKAIKSEALDKLTLDFEVRTEGDRLTMTIRDNGTGIDWGLFSKETQYIKAQAAKFGYQEIEITDKKLDKLEKEGVHKTIQLFNKDGQWHIRGYVSDEEGEMCLIDELVQEKSNLFQQLNTLPEKSIAKEKIPEYLQLSGEYLMARKYILGIQKLNYFDFLSGKATIQSNKGCDEASQGGYGAGLAQGAKFLKALKGDLFMKTDPSGGCILEMSSPRLTKESQLKILWAKENSISNESAVSIRRAHRKDEAKKSVKHKSSNLFLGQSVGIKLTPEKHFEIEKLAGYDSTPESSPEKGGEAPASGDLGVSTDDRKEVKNRRMELSLLGTRKPVVKKLAYSEGQTDLQSSELDALLKEDESSPLPLALSETRSKGRALGLAPLSIGSAVSAGGAGFFSLPPRRGGGLGLSFVLPETVGEKSPVASPKKDGENEGQVSTKDGETSPGWGESVW